VDNDELLNRIRAIPHKAEHYPADWSAASNETLKKLYADIGYYVMSYLEIFEEVAGELDRREQSNE